MFTLKVTDDIDLRLLDHPHAGALFDLVDKNRAHLREWLFWVDLIKSPADIDKIIANSRQHFAANRGIQAGIWYRGQLCGSLSHLAVDWSHRTAFLTYWLDAGHTGKGIMTSACRAFIAHSFDAWNLNRIAIECGTANFRSRAIPERLGFKLEGVIRDAEWLYDHYVDHALYGLLQSDRAPSVSA